ncbi:MAG: hypothetical protein ACXWV6_14325 [Chitinophagaceae bacterium]
MKTNFTYILIIRIILFILLCLYSFLVFGQTDSVSQRDIINRSAGIQPGTAAASNLVGFTGLAAEEKTELRFSLATNNNVSTVILEKGHAKDAFKACAEFWVNFDGNKETNFRFADKKNDKGVVYYRLKIVEANGSVQYSNILHFNGRKKSNGSIAASASPNVSSVNVNNDKFDLADKI